MKTWLEIGDACIEDIRQYYKSDTRNEGVAIATAIVVSTVLVLTYLATKEKS